MGLLDDSVGGAFDALTSPGGDFGKGLKGFVEEQRKRRHSATGQALLSSIRSDETISEFTRQELLRDLQSVQESDVFITDKAGATMNLFDSAAAKETTGFTLLGRESAATFSEIKSSLEEAQAGKGKFAGRQISEKKRERLRDQPGQRQFLVPNSSRSKPASPILGE